MARPISLSGNHPMTGTEPGQLPEYAAVDQALQRAGIDQCPAELHGFAIGMSVGGVSDTKAIWEREVYAMLDPSDVLAAECRRLLDRVFAAASGERDATPMVLTLLLPDDVMVDSQRLEALRDWIQGFLFGLGLAGDSVATALSAEARELLADFDEISRVETDDVENSEENQAALIEVEEYLREGVMLIRDEIGGLRQRPAERSPDTE
jgi:uncharacterized protein YgfB (UPF0149 family)